MKPRQTYSFALWLKYVSEEQSDQGFGFTLIWNSCMSSEAVAIPLNGKRRGIGRGKYVKL